MSLHRVFAGSAREKQGTVVRKATAQDVADLVGVSRSAVSLVLNGRAQGHIARDKQQAIVDAARQLNYTPNAVALSLRSRRTRTIGVLTWSGAVGFAERMLHATLQTATRAGYLLIFMDMADDRDHQSHALATLRDHQVDALLVIAPDLIAYRPVEPMSTIPTILVNCVDPGAGVASIVPGRARREISGGSSPHRGRAHPYWRRCRPPGRDAESAASLGHSVRRGAGARHRLGTDGAQPGHQLGLRRGLHATRRTRHADGTHLHSRAASSRCPARGRRSWVRHSSRPVDCQPRGR